jgi:hypothetical protein
MNPTDGEVPRVASTKDSSNKRRRYSPSTRLARLDIFGVTSNSSTSGRRHLSYAAHTRSSLSTVLAGVKMEQCGEWIDKDGRPPLDVGMLLALLQARSLLHGLLGMVFSVTQIRAWGVGVVLGGPCSAHRWLAGAGFIDTVAE